jgi:hypothetical protein
MDGTIERIVCCAVLCCAVCLSDGNCLVMMAKILLTRMTALTLTLTLTADFFQPAFHCISCLSCCVGEMMMDALYTLGSVTQVRDMRQGLESSLRHTTPCHAAPALFSVIFFHVLHIWLYSSFASHLTQVTPLRSPLLLLLILYLSFTPTSTVPILYSSTSYLLLYSSPTSPPLSTLSHLLPPTSPLLLSLPPR